MGRIRGGGGVPGGVLDLFGRGPVFSGALPRNFKWIIRVLSSSPIYCHLFWANWAKEGVCGHVQKSEAHAFRCRPRGESSQWSSKSLQTFRIVPRWRSFTVLGTKMAPFPINVGNGFHCLRRFIFFFLFFFFFCQFEVVGRILKNRSNLGLCRPVVGAW